MKELNEISVSNMNYLFLKQIFNLESFKAVETIVKNEYPRGYGMASELLEIVLEEFLRKLSKATLSDELKQDFINELDEGGYIDDLTIEEFREILQEGLLYLMGYVDDNIVELYIDFANQINLNSESIKIPKKDLEEISKLMEAYSENGDLYSEFGIEEDVNHYSFNVEFRNKYKACINVNSGQCNCYIDYILYTPSGNESCCIIGDDAIQNGDIIEFEVDKEKYFVKIEEI